jgi:TRAP-type C4-dicarboxylate transport system substrate-binding protein
MTAQTKIRKLAAATALGGAALLAAAPSAGAAEKLSLTMISGYPQLAAWTGAAVEAFIPKVNETLAKTGNYEIDWNIAIAGQVVRATGEIEGVEAGLGDVGVVVTAAAPDKAPLYAVSFNTPFTTLDMTLLSDTMKALADTFPAYQAGWQKLNQIGLQPASAVDNMMVWTDKKVTKLSELQGMKIGAIGPNLRWVQPIGAIGVNTDLVKAYPALDNGVFSGAIFWPAAAGQFKICEPAPYALDADIGAVSGFSLNVNMDSWNAFPDEVKQAFTEAAPLWKDNNIARVKKVTGIMVGKCQKEFGTEFTKLTDAERKQWAMALPPLGKEWAAARDKAGEPGTEILKSYMDTMRAANQPIARNWDRE